MDEIVKPSIRDLKWKRVKKTDPYYLDKRYGYRPKWIGEWQGYWNYGSTKREAYDLCMWRWIADGCKQWHRR